MAERRFIFVSAGAIVCVSALVGWSLDREMARRAVGAPTSLSLLGARLGWAADLPAPKSDEARARDEARTHAAARSDLQPVDLFGAMSRAPSSAKLPRLNPNASVNRAWLLSEGPFHVEGDGRRIVTLTFDDGPVPETTPNVLDALRECNLHASFFVLGQNLDTGTDRAELSRGILRHTVEEGHLVGNHSETHAYLPPLSHDAVIDEVERGRAAIENALGKTTPLFRPPFGKLDEFGIAYSKERHLELVLWNVEDGGDGLSEAVFQRVRERIEFSGGGIVLLHDSRITTASVVRKLCAWQKARAWNPDEPSKLGYAIVDLPTFFTETARSPQPFESRADLELARAERMNGYRDTPPRPRPEARDEEALASKKTPANGVRKVRHSPAHRR